MANNSLNATEALFGFAAWLTSRKEQIVLSSSSDAGPVAALVQVFCNANHLPAVTENFPHNLARLPLEGEQEILE